MTSPLQGTFNHVRLTGHVARMKKEEMCADIFLESLWAEIILENKTYIEGTVK